jgi:hypothetical protein
MGLRLACGRRGRGDGCSADDYTSGSTPLIGLRLACGRRGRGDGCSAAISHRCICALIHCDRTDGLAVVRTLVRPTHGAVCCMDAPCGPHEVHSDLCTLCSMHGHTHGPRTHAVRTFAPWFYGVSSVPRARRLATTHSIGPGRGGVAATPLWIGPLDCHRGARFEGRGGSQIVYFEAHCSQFGRAPTVR